MIRIYTAPSCASCRKVKSWLNENKIPYVEKNIKTNRNTYINVFLFLSCNFIIFKSFSDK